MNFAKFLRTLFLHNASGRLLLLLLLLLFLILSVTIIIFNIIMIIIIIINFIFSIIDIIVSVTIFYRPIWVPIRVTEERYSSRCIRPSGSQVIGPELSDCGISYKQQIWLIKGRSCKSSLKGAGRKAFPFFFSSGFECKFWAWFKTILCQWFSKMRVYVNIYDCHQYHHGCYSNRCY